MTKKQAERETRAGLAKRWGCTRQAVGQLLKRNGIRPGSDGLFDVAAVEEALNGAGSDGAGMSLAEAVRRKEAALAQLRELELECKSEKVVNVEWVRQTVERQIQSLRAVVLSFPTMALGETGGDDGTKRAVYAATMRLRDKLLRQLAGATAEGPNIELCSTCTKRVLEEADKYEFPPEAFTNTSRA